MRILAIHRYYWPDTPPYATMLRSMVARWHQVDGHEVTVLSAPPSYTSADAAQWVPQPGGEQLDGTPVQRVRVVNERVRGGQLLNLVVFPVQVAARILRMPRQEVIMCSTAPQVTLGFAVALAARARGSAFVYHCMDIHPEIGRLSGEFANPVVFRILSWMDRRTVRSAARVIVLSRDMAQTLIERDPGVADKVVILNNFSLPDFDPPTQLPQIPSKTVGRTRVIFAGNLGRFQGLESVIDAIAALPEQADIEMIFMGEGKAKAELEQRVAALPAPIAAKFTFLPHAPVSAAKALMATADLGLVSLVPEVVNFAYPSKTATYLGEGLPVLLLCEPESALATDLVAAQVAVAVRPGDQAGLIEALREELNRTEGERAQRHEAARGYAAGEFAEDAVLGRWSELMKSVATPSGGTAPVGEVSK